MKASRKPAGVGVCLSSCWIQRCVVKELVDPNFNLVDSKDAAVKEESEELTLRVGEKTGSIRTGVRCALSSFSMQHTKKSQDK